MREGEIGKHLKEIMRSAIISLQPSLSLADGLPGWGNLELDESSSHFQLPFRVLYVRKGKGHRSLKRSGWIETEENSNC